MSWSYYKTGTATAVKEHAAKALKQCADNCANIPPEKKSIESLAAAVDSVCDGAEGQAVRVSGNGSAWYQNGVLKSYTFKAEIEVIDLQD